MTGAEAIDLARRLRELQRTVNTERSEIHAATSGIEIRRVDHNTIQGEMTTACDALRSAANRMEAVAGYLLVKAAMEERP